MTIRLTEHTDSRNVLTVTLWADDDIIDDFGGILTQNDDLVRANAAAAANMMAGRSSEGVRPYDSFLYSLNWIKTTTTP